MIKIVLDRGGRKGLSVPRRGAKGKLVADYGGREGLGKTRSKMIGKRKKKKGR